MKYQQILRLAVLFSVLAVLSMQPESSTLAEGPVVRSLLFYSPSCGHCHYVITEFLPPVLEQYGDQLQILGVDISAEAGQLLYRAAVERFSITEDRLGVPTLIVGETVLVGSGEIPALFPGLIEQYLAQGGVALPDIPGLADALQSDSQVDESVSAALARSEAASAEQVEAVPDETTGLVAAEAGALLPTDAVSGNMIEKFQQDPVGNSLSVVVLVGIVVVLGWAVRRIWRYPKVVLSQSPKGAYSWAIVAICLVGLGVSIYMAYVEMTHTTAVCGPIGDCNTVQQSPYAVLFGLIPIGVFGIFGYGAILIAWIGARWGQGQIGRLLEAALWAMALFGTLFSIYLTFLEPFVIGATCAWCLTSAVSMTLILFVLARSMSYNVEPARQEARA
jgi:uncharacterized membrane protein